MCRAELDREKHGALKGVINPLTRIERDQLSRDALQRAESSAS
jgi:hypothetical protein